MVRATALGMLVLASIGAGPGPDPDRAVGSALGKGSFPWYDAPRDSVRSILVPADREGARSSPSRGSSSGSSTSPPSAPPGNWGLGDFVSFAGFAVALVALIGLLVWFWRLYEPAADAGAEGPSKPGGEPSRVEELPAGLRSEFDASDPWAEAIRRRDRGDLAGAVVCLFAHQLLTMARLGLVRLAPGRTGRQLVRSVSDVEFRRLLAPTLRLFEAAYYGHHAPTAEDFAAAWAGAEAFERRVAAGGVP